MFVRASECTVSISQQVRDTKKWGFFILHVSRINVFLEIHIDFQKCTKHHIFIPFQNNPYVSFWLQKVNISLENKITLGSLYMCTLAYTNMNFFIWHWLPLGAFWGQLFWKQISHAPSENSYFMRVSLDFFSLCSRWAAWSPPPTKARSLLPPHARSLCIVRSYCYLCMREADWLSRTAKSSWLLHRQVLFLREIHFNPLERSYVDLW